MNHDGLPKELMAMPNWTTWKWVTEKGELKKIPFQLNGIYKAKSNDSSTWTSFKMAYTGLTDTDGVFDGICWMMPSKPGKYIFIDIDHCVKDGTIEPWALEVVKKFDSYAEISQSGHGVHILIVAKKAIKRCRKNGSPYEIYDCLRPCYLTGDVIDGHTSIEVRQEQLNGLYHEIFGEDRPRAITNPTSKRGMLSDDALILKAKMAKNGSEFELLWNGSTLGYNGDDSAADMALMNKLAFWTGGDVAQMERLFSRSGLGKRDKWHDRADYRERTIEKAITDAREFYKQPENRIDETFFASMDNEELTEGGNASRLERICGEELRYCHTFNKWYLWHDGRWQIDTDGGASRIAVKVVNELYIAAANADGKDDRKAIAKFAKETDSRKGIANMLALAGSRLIFAITANKLDPEAWLLGAGNVTFDLKTGNTREPHREDLITKAIGANYDRAAQCPLWKQFLDRIFASDAELISYVKRAVGYCLTGSMNEQVFFFCHGDGSNGKSKFLAVLRGLLGDYAKQADFSSFLVQRNEKVRNDLAALAGARVITATEAEEGSRLSMAVIKSWTGGDPITARFLFGENFTFQPTGKLWLAANNKPAISERNHAAWRRVQLIPFNVTIPEEEQDKDIEVKLLKELSGILNWALEGLADYLKMGLKTPTAVKAATDKYRKENDSLEEFLSECCDIQKLKVCKNTDLYSAYLNFCGMSGLSALSQTKFSPELNQRREIKSTRKPHGITWTGIDLKDEWKFGGNSCRVEDACRVEDDPTSLAIDVKHVGSSPNAQSITDSFLRENLAQKPAYPTYPSSNESIDSDSQKSNTTLACRAVVGQEGLVMFKVERPIQTKRIREDPGFEEFKAKSQAYSRNTCRLCGHHFETPLAIGYHGGYICEPCRRDGPPSVPPKADAQTTIGQ